MLQDAREGAGSIASKRSETCRNRGDTLEYSYAPQSVAAIRHDVRKRAYDHATAHHSMLLAVVCAQSEHELARRRATFGICFTVRLP